MTTSRARVIVPASGFLVAGDELEQRRLAGAVGADHRDPAPGADHQADVAEEVLRGVALRHARDGHEAHGALSMVAGERSVLATVPRATHLPSRVISVVIYP